MIVKYCLSDLLLMIALIVGAAIVFVVIVTVILYFVCRRKETEQKPQEGSLPYKGNMFWNVYGWKRKSIGKKWLIVKCQV